MSSNKQTSYPHQSDNMRSVHIATIEKSDNEIAREVEVILSAPSNLPSTVPFKPNMSHPHRTVNFVPINPPTPSNPSTPPIQRTSSHPPPPPRTKRMRPMVFDNNFNNQIIKRLRY